MNASKIKPSEAHGNEDVLRAKATEANKKRAQRKREQAREEAREQEAQRKREAEEARAREEQARQEAEEPKTEEPKTEEPKAEKTSRKFGKVIKVRANGVEYATLTEFILTLPNCSKVDGKHSAYAISQWNKVNGQLKKKGWTEINGIVVEAI